MISHMKLLLSLLLLACSRDGHIALVAKEASIDSILYVILDDVSEEDLAAAQTPNIDALALTGCTFTSAFVSPNCITSRRSLMFGTWSVRGSGPACQPPTSEAPALDDVSVAELSLIPSMMAGKWHLGGNSTGGPYECAAQAQGFQVWSGLSGNVNSCGGSGYEDWDLVSSCSSSTSSAYHPQDTTDALVSWWVASKGPRLAVMSLNLAHAPFHDPPASVLPPGYPTPTNKWERFHAMITAYDFLLGQVLSNVDMERTLVVVVGDNGTPPPVAPVHAKSKGTVYDRGIHVPLIISHGSFSQTSSSELVAGVDAYATIADFLGSSEYGDGMSLRPALLGLPFQGREYILTGVPEQVAARSAGYKLIRALPSGAELFFDLTSDPAENTDVLDDPAYATLVLEHRAWLDANLPSAQ